jgi:hypothetical protein
VAGYNGDGARLFKNPGIPNVVSEYGAILKPAPANYEPYFGDLQNEEFPWRSGQVIWCGADHGSNGGFLRGQKGLVDYFRLPKRCWYWYRNEYKKIPPPEWPVEGIPAGLRLTADKTVISAPDGTDDVQLVVTVVDQAGKPLSNSPPVTLNVESGPGEFPTGPSITFDPASDIVIRDGRAAIEFRSYYAGKSVIRASSPGLPDSRLTITTNGTPAFIPGKTPPAASRPYVKFGNADQKNPAVDQGNIAKLRPTRASSEITGHTGRFATDEDAATYWSAAENDSKPWLEIDLESAYRVSGVKLTFPSLGEHHYFIELSMDGKTWTKVFDRTTGNIQDAVRNNSFPTNSTGKLLRITLVGLPLGTPARLNEVEVFGSIFNP